MRYRLLLVLSSMLDNAFVKGFEKSESMTRRGPRRVVLKLTHDQTQAPDSNTRSFR